MHRVLREIHFSYGHRLPGHPGKCARLHGHNARVLVEVSSERLNEQKMVMDFYEIRSRIEGWIDAHLDHRMILSKKDPLTAVLNQQGEPIVVTDESPTAEVLAQWIYEESLKQGIPVTRVTLWETPDSAAVYERNRA